MRASRSGQLFAYKQNRPEMLFSRRPCLIKNNASPEAGLRLFAMDLSRHSAGKTMGIMGSVSGGLRPYRFRIAGCLRKNQRMNNERLLRGRHR